MASRARCERWSRRTGSSRCWACATRVRSTGTTSQEWNRLFANAAEWHGPIVVHVLTQKGRGYTPAEDDEVQRLHDFKVQPVRLARQGTSPLVSYTDAFTRAILREAEQRPELVAITAAMPGPTGLLPFQAAFGDRFLDVGIAEQHAVTAAAGMAMTGLRPVVAIYSTFFFARLRPSQPGRGAPRTAGGVRTRPCRCHR